MGDCAAIARTVCGDRPLAPSALVNTHAHLVVDLAVLDADRYPDFRLDAIDTASELLDFSAAGGHVVVELTPWGTGRNPRALRLLSEQTGVDVVAGTGIYHEPFHPPMIDGWAVEQLADHFVRELTEGMEGTEVRAGIIGEIGTSRHPVTDRERAVLSAAGAASARTGAAVTTHTYLGRHAEEQIDVLTAAGARPDRIVIGHLDDVAPIDLEVCRRIVRRGAVAQFDGIGCEYHSATTDAQNPTDRARLEALMQLAEDGWADQLVIGSDMCRRRHLRAAGGPGFGHLPGSFRVLASSTGVPDELIERWTVRTPARLLDLSAEA